MKTVIPSLAVANVSIRLAPGQQAEEIAAEFERLLREAAPSDAVLQVELLNSAPPAIVPADSPAVQLGLDAFERALGVRPVLIRSGGTLPLFAALADRGIPTILTGFFLPDANIHAPNERLLTEYVEPGMDAAKELLQELRTLSSLPLPAEGNGILPVLVLPASPEPHAARRATGHLLQSSRSSTPTTHRALIPGDRRPGKALPSGRLFDEDLNRWEELTL